VAGEGRTRQLLLVVDQFEELLTLTGPTAREHFAGLLKTALGGPMRVVATLRADFLGPLLASAELADLPTRSFTLRPLARTALPTVIEGPAQLAGIGVDDDLVSRLVTDADTGDALPLLAFTLAQLADGVGRGGQLSAARYDQLGGVQGALIGQADAALADALAAGGRTRDQVIAGLLRLVTVDEQGRPIRSRANRNELPAPVRAELDAFVARRLLTTDTDDDGRVVLGVAHEAFLSAWPPLAAAITAAVSGLRTRRGVEQAAADWDDAGRPPDQLWERGQLAAAVTGAGARLTTSEQPPDQMPAETPQKRPRPAALLPRRRRALVTDKVDLSSRGRDFLRLSIRRDRRRRSRAITILSALLILADTAAGVAFIQQRAAQEQQRIATVRELIARAAATRDQDPRTALLLGLAADAIHSDRETAAGLINTLMASRFAGTLPSDAGAMTPIAFAPNGDTLATGGEDAAVLLWDLAETSRLDQLGQPLIDHGGFVSAMAFDPDGRTLATTSPDGTVILWDLTDRGRPDQLGQPLDVAPAGELSAVAFDPDGRTLTYIGTDGKVILWNLADRDRPDQLGQPRKLPGTFVNSLAFDPNFRTLATIVWPEEKVILWDLTDRNRPVQLGQPLTVNVGGFVDSMAFTSDGRTLATAGGDGRVILWDLTDRDRPEPLGQPLTVPGGVVNSVGFTSDGRTLATGGDGTVILWNLGDRDRPIQLGQPLTVPGGVVDSMAFNPDGRTLATISADGSMYLWDLVDPDRPIQLGQPLSVPDVVNAYALDAYGRTLATADDRGVTLWDLIDPDQPIQLGQPVTVPGDVSSVEFTSDGNMLATASGDDLVMLWELADRGRLDQLGQPVTVPGSFVNEAAFDPNFRTLATTGGDGNVLLWDMTDLDRPVQLGKPLNVPGDIATSLGFTSDGRTLATASDDSRVILWDLSDRARPDQLGQPLTVPGGPVNSVDFDPDGRTLATAGRDGRVILWDLADRDRPDQLGQPLTVPASFLISVAFDPDGHTLTTIGGDGPVIRWDLTGVNQARDHLLGRACDLTGAGLSREEWRRHVPGLPYEETCSGQ
jgi:WD40 repeat protein